MRCAAITRVGERCKLDATSGSYCWSHAPENSQERKRRAARGGKASRSRPASGGELRQVKQGIRTVIAAVLRGRLDKGRGAVALQGYNTLLRAVEQERRNRETQDLEVRIGALEKAGDEQRGAKTWRRT
jgi:hypothetical protein